MIVVVRLPRFKAQSDILNQLWAIRAYAIPIYIYLPSSIFHSLAIRNVLDAIARYEGERTGMYIWLCEERPKLSFLEWVHAPPFMDD